MGTPVFESTELDTCSPASALPRNPCSGEKMATTLNLFSSSMSSRCLSPIIPVWLEKMAIRFPFRMGKYSEVCSSPRMTLLSDCAAACNRMENSNVSDNRILFMVISLRIKYVGTKIVFFLVSETHFLFLLGLWV